MKINFFEHKIRVRYGETDQMGFVYYGNYALYLEEARTEMLRSIGFSYKKLEAMNVFLPVVNLNIRYKNPARYDDLLQLKTVIKACPARTIVFETEIFNEQNILLNRSEVVLVFMDAEQNVTTCPEDITVALKKYSYVL